MDWAMATRKRNFRRTRDAGRGSLSAKPESQLSDRIDAPGCQDQLKAVIRRKSNSGACLVDSESSNHHEMKTTLVGAAGGEVTGSCYIVRTEQARILVDCGLFQGGKKPEALNRPPTAPNRTVDAVILTHGHLDHTGRLPLLSKMG